MTLSIRDAVRTAVIGTNAIWPFSSLNRVPYHVAIKAFIRVCKDYPEIKSVYLRSGFAEGRTLSVVNDMVTKSFANSRSKTNVGRVTKMPNRINPKHRNSAI